MAIEKNDPNIENWRQVGESRGWSIEQTAAHVEALGSPDLAAELRAAAAEAKGDQVAARSAAPKGRRSATADETA